MTKPKQQSTIEVIAIAVLAFVISLAIDAWVLMLILGGINNQAPHVPALSFWNCIGLWLGTWILGNAWAFRVGKKQ